MAINFFLSPFVVRHLGTTGYGVWSLLLSLTGYLGLLDLGVRGAVTRYVAKFHTSGEDREASNVASSAMVIFSSVGLLAILVSLIFAGLVAGRMDIPPQYLSSARIVLVLAGLNVATSLINGVFGGILVGLQRFDLTNSIEVGISLLRTAAIVIALRMGYSIVALACIQLAFTLLRWGANVVLIRILYPELRLRFSEANRAGVKLIFSFSAFSFMLHVSGSLIYASDNVVIGAYLPVTAVAFYVIGGNLIEYTRTLASGISQTMTPLASSIESLKDQERLKRMVLLSSRAATMVILPIAVTFILRGSGFIGLWMGQQYAGLSGHVLWILAFTLIFWPANTVTSGTMLGLSKHKPLVPVALAEGVSNLLLSIFLIKRIGVVGVAWGTLIPSLGTSLLFWPWYVRRTLGIQPFTYIASAWIRPVIAAVPFALGSYLVEQYWPARHLAVFVLQVLVTLPLAAIGYWAICVEPGQRNSIKARVRKPFRTLSPQEAGADHK
jgi:O-antigen/teichoic acid export membrane protein